MIEIDRTDVGQVLRHLEYNIDNIDVAVLRFINTGLNPQNVQTITITLHYAVEFTVLGYTLSRCIWHINLYYGFPTNKGREHLCFSRVEAEEFLLRNMSETVNDSTFSVVYKSKEETQNA